MNQHNLLKQQIALRVAATNHVAERFLAEMDFVEGLIACETDAAGQGRQPSTGFAAGKWTRLAEQAWACVERALAERGERGLTDAVPEAEALLAPIARVAKGYTVHCVGHAHIDMNWMWSWPETVQVTNDTFLTMLKLMDEYPDFCFTQSQASVYEIVARYHPEMLETIRQRVREGRWEVAASHWVEGDKNLVSGESQARHLLYTRKYMRELFGLTPEDVPVEWTPDTFGHALSLAACETRGGVRRVYMCRGGQGWSKPPVFWYQSPDGSRVLVNYETTWYNDHISPHNTKALLAFCRQTGLRDWMNVYGVGDHGGGPTRRDIERCHDMNRWPVYPTFQLATSRAFYEILEKQGDRWPVIDRELNFEFPGCYTTQTNIKRNNRLAEIYGVESEWAAVLGSLVCGLAYPEDKLERIWRDVCFNHFHDILPGSGVAATRTFNDGQFQQIAADTSMIKMNALRALAARIDTQANGARRAAVLPPERTPLSMGGGAGQNTMIGGISSAGHVAQGPRPYVIFNPIAATRAEVVSATVWDPQTGLPGEELKAMRYIVQTADGRTIRAQKLNQGDGYWGHQFVDLAFPVTVGALGYTTCVATVDDGAQEPESLAEIEVKPVGGWGMENEYLLVELDAQSGGIKRLVDKASGRNLADAAHPMGVLEMSYERPGGMTAWVIHETYKRLTPEITALKRKQNGPWVASIEARTKVAGSEATVTYTLQAGQPWVEIAVQTRWVEIGNPTVGIPKLSMAFPMALADARATYEMPFGAIERQECAGEEVPGLRWADVNGRSGADDGGRRTGCALLNNCKYGHALAGNTLRLTLIRSSYDPDPIPEVGDHAVRMALVPHGATLPTAALTHLAAAFNQPLQVVSTDVHAGALPARLTAITCAAANVVVSSIKKAQGGEALIVCLYETAGKATQARITLAPEIFGRVLAAEEVDFLERDVAENTARTCTDGVRVKLEPHAIVSVRVTLQR
jgi:alpha-mannosidase